MDNKTESSDKVSLASEVASLLKGYEDTHLSPAHEGLMKAIKKIAFRIDSLESNSNTSWVKCKD